MTKYQENREELSFSQLFSAVLRDWPESIDCHSLLYCESILDGSFEVEGLGSLERGIEERYIGHPQEVLLRNLHQSILIAIHSVARFYTVVRPSELRPEIVKQRFEKSLRYAETRKQLDWQPLDIQLVHAYFEAN